MASWTPALISSLTRREKAQLLELQEEKERRTARRNINTFVEVVLKDEQGLPLRQAAVHRQWHAHTAYCEERGLRPLIVAPWGHGKTTQIVIGRALWELGRDRNQRIGIICNSDENARRRVAAIKHYIERDADYRRVFPEVVPDKGRGWEKHQFYVERDGTARSVDPSVFAAGVSSTGIGGRLDGLILDDVVDRRNAIAMPTLRQQVIDTVKETWMSRLEPWGWLAYIATVWHEADLTHHLVLDPDVRGRYLALVQAVSEDYCAIETHLVGDADVDYPVVGALGHGGAAGATGADRE